MELAKTVSNYFSNPYKVAAPRYLAAQREGSFGKSICPRLLFLVQAICSFVALFFILGAGVLDVLWNAITREKDWSESAKYTLYAMGQHAFFKLPMSLLAALGPADCAIRVTHRFGQCFDQFCK
jgi:hypothetical protein